VEVIREVEVVKEEVSSGMIQLLEIPIDVIQHEQVEVIKEVIK
jgi:hypothetical protein